MIPEPLQVRNMRITPALEVGTPDRLFQACLSTTSIPEVVFFMLTGAKPLSEIEVNEVKHLFQISSGFKAEPSSISQLREMSSGYPNRIQEIHPASERD
jgi:hypothetical protein